MLQQGKSHSEIAASIAKDKSVISREIVRNKDQRSGVYSHDLAHRKYAQRQKRKPKKKRFTLRIQFHVETLLKEDYSPEQIVGISIKEGIDCVSHERIYQHVWKDKKH